jgi:hypothetical protein
LRLGASSEFPPASTRMAGRNFTATANGTDAIPGLSFRQYGGLLLNILLPGRFLPARRAIPIQ